jgi:hypothetical protein
MNAEQLHEAMAGVSKDAPVEIGWSWSTAKIKSCSVSPLTGVVTIEADLKKIEWFAGIYGFLVIELAKALDDLETEILPTCSESTRKKLEMARHRMLSILTANEKSRHTEGSAQ